MCIKKLTRIVHWLRPGSCQSTTTTRRAVEWRWQALVFEGFDKLGVGEGGSTESQ